MFFLALLVFRSDFWGFMQKIITLIKGDKVELGKVEYRDALPTNMYAVPRPILGAAGYMQQINGLSEFGTTSNASNGGLYCTAPNFEGHYRVHGNDFISVDSNGAVTVLGEVGGTGQADIWFSFQNVAIVRDNRLWYYNQNDGFREIVDDPEIESVVGNPVSGCYCSSVMFLTDGNQIYHCTFDELGGVPNEEVWLPTNSTIPEYEPSKVYAVRQAENDEAIVFKSESIEHYYLAGGDDPFLFAFVPANQKATSLGVVGTHAMAKSKGNWYLVGVNKESFPSVYIYRSGGYNKVASRDVEKFLRAYSESELETITVDVVIEDDVELVYFHLPNETLIFNATIAQQAGKDNAWSIAKSNTEDLSYRGKDFVQDKRTTQWVAGDKYNGNLGIYDENVATHYGDIAEWLLFSPLMKQFETLSIDEIEIETIAGIADDSEDATVFISTTVDFGRTYSKEYTQLYGEKYNYTKRFLTRSLGYVRDSLGFKFRGASRSRMAFATFQIKAS